MYIVSLVSGKTESNSSIDKNGKEKRKLFP